MNPLEHAGTPLNLALYRPNISTSMGNNGIAYRVSFEVTEESFLELSRTKDFKRLILEAQLMMVNHDNKLVGGNQSNIAGMMCNDPNFHLFIKDRALQVGTAIEMSNRFQVIEAKTAKEKWPIYAKFWLCHNCGIKSRKELDNSDMALANFAELKRLFSEYCRTNGINSAYIGV
jgi:hypothetical protein